jgi:hypothetical protein
MEKLEVTIMSSLGKIVVPLEIRETLVQTILENREEKLTVKAGYECLQHDYVR